ncbi:MAG: hypothetical protein HUJ76_01470 [Parasporobacterium sp.]|nr:hypothetical protein [Parasporobacterium sp.]
MKKICICISLMISLVLIIVCYGFAADKNTGEAGISSSAPESNVDIRKEFLTWLFTSDKNERSRLYNEIIEKTLEDISIPADDGSGVLSEVNDNAVDELWKEYYAPVADIVTSVFAENMKKDRIPYSWDNMNLEHGVSVKVIDIEFGKETISPFAKGTIYDYDVFLETDGDIRSSGIPYYQLREDGLYHITGQITVDDNLITKIYINNAIPGS